MHAHITGKRSRRINGRPKKMRKLAFTLKNLLHTRSTNGVREEEKGQRIVTVCAMLIERGTD